MATITVEGLGQVEIAGDTPNSQEIEAIRQALETSGLSEENILSIEDYKKQNPETANIPDIKLAENIFKEQYRGKMDETKYFESAFPNIAAKRATENIISPDDEFNANLEFEQTKEKFKPTTPEIARETGVSVNDPASSDARFGGSLGYNPEQKKLAIQKTLSTAFDQDIDVRVGPNTGELEYYNPKTKQYALVDKPGLDVGDLADIGGDLMVIGPDIFATIGIGLLTGGTGGITAGAAAAMAGEYGRLKLGQKKYGINKDMTDEQLWNSMKSTGKTSLAFGVLGLGAAKTIKGINNIVSGRNFSDDAVEALRGAGVKETDEIAKTINDSLDAAKMKSKLKFTLAQATDDPDLLASQAAFETTKRFGFVDEFRTFNRENADALNDYFSVLKSGFGTMKNVTPSSNASKLTLNSIKEKATLEIQGAPKIAKELRKPITTFDAGVLIQKVIKEQQDPIIQNIIKKQQQSEKLLTKSVFNLPDGNVKITGEETRSIINSLGKAYKIEVDKAAKSLDKAAKGQAIDTDIIADTIAKLSKKEKLTLVNAAKSEGIFKKEIFDVIANPDARIPLSNARETVKSLTELIFTKGLTGSVTGEANKATGGISIGKVMSLKSAFMKQINKNAGRGYVNELENFNDLVIKNKQLLNNETISSLTSIENGILKIANEDIFASTFKRGVGSGKAAKEVYDVIGQSPEALRAYKNSIYEFYKTKVLTDGVPNLTKHKAFIEVYEAPLNQFFNAAEISKISRIGGLQKIIEKNAKIAKETEKKLFKSFEGRLESGSPQDVFKKIYASDNVGEIRVLKNILKTDSEAFSAFQRNVLTDLNEKSLVGSTVLGRRILDAESFNKYLNGKGGEKGHRNVLTEIFGSEYVKNLDVLNNALKVLSRKSPSTAAEGFFANVFTDIMRTHLGQFSKPGRILTATRRLATGASNRMIKNALLNPNSLKLLIELKKLKPGSKRTAIILHKLGGHVFIPNEGEEIVPILDKSEPTTKTPDINDYYFGDVIGPKDDVEELIRGDQSFLQNTQPTNQTVASAAPISSPPINQGIMNAAPSNMTSGTNYNNLSSLEKDKLLRGIS